METYTKTNTKARLLGPVNNLEAHLKPDWWKEIFNEIYLKTDGDVVEDNDLTRRETDFFNSILKAGSKARILDLACGQGRHLLELARRGFENLYGIDRSGFLVQRARHMAGKEGLKINVQEGDARQLPFDTASFDVVTILGNSFGYFEKDEDDQALLKEAKRVLKAGGVLLLDISDGTYISKHFKERGWEWIDKENFVCRERALSNTGDRLISRELVGNIHKGIEVDQFYAERLYSKPVLEQVLIGAGFRNINFHNGIKTSSKRNQDLGMMEQRFVVTSHKPEQNGANVNGALKVKNVVVILGDPDKNDVIKPDGVFDADDFYTINQLVKSLGTAKNYRFTYLNNHDTLMDDLRNLKEETDFVLNLCDEGFNNDARLELHVPALLEMLKIPYSGSNPQCLAYCYDKSLVRCLAIDLQVPVSRAKTIHHINETEGLELQFPVIVKPNYGDASFGITKDSVAYDKKGMLKAIRNLQGLSGTQDSIIIEEFLPGAEFTIGIIGNPSGSYTFLPIVEEDYSGLPKGLPKICGYEAKWQEESPYFKNLRSIPAAFDPQLEEELKNHCLKLFKRLGCRDYCRFDWRMDPHGNPKLLEVNPNPGWCWDGHLAKMAQFGQMEYPSMLIAILDAVDQRLKREPKS